MMTLPLTPDLFTSGELAASDTMYQRLWKPISDKIMSELGDLAWHEIGAAGEPAFQNGWTNYNAPPNTVAGYRLRQGRVFLKGLIGGGTLGSSSAGVAFVLPVGYRPGQHEIFLCAAHLGGARVDVLPTGEVEIVDSVQTGGDAGTWCSLDQVRFLQEG